MRSVPPLVVLALLLAAGSAPQSFAQQPAKASPILRGKVRDQNGAVISGVNLRLEPQEQLHLYAAVAAVVDAKTDQSGSYEIVAAGEGRYTLTATKWGFLPITMKDIVLAAGEERWMDLVMLIPRGEVSCGANAICHLDEPAIPTKESPVPGPQFSDEPNFKVAGLTDRSNMGLHGSDANVRTSDALAKETAALKSASEKGASVPGAGDARRMAGDAREKSGDPVGAEKEYEAAVKLDPSEENYFTWGAELLLHHAGPATVQVFAKGSELHPLSERLRAGLGAAYYADGQFNEAAAQMCRASDLNTSDAQPYLFLGRMEKAAAEPFACSEPLLKRFVDEQPGNALAHYYYALVLWKKARKAQDAAGFAAAEEHLRRAAELDPSLGDVYLQLGLLYNARGQKDAALAQLQRAVAAQPGLSAGHYQLSLAYRRAGDTARADAEMKKYEELRRSEDAQLEKERREMRQFVTVMKDAAPQKH